MPLPLGADEGSGPSTSSPPLGVANRNFSQCTHHGVAARYGFRLHSLVTDAVGVSRLCLLDEVCSHLLPLFTYSVGRVPHVSWTQGLSQMRNLTFSSQPLVSLSSPLRCLSNRRFHSVWPYSFVLTAHAHGITSKPPWTQSHNSVLPCLLSQVLGIRFRPKFRINSCVGSETFRLCTRMSSSSDAVPRKDRPLPALSLSPLGRKSDAQTCAVVQAVPLCSLSARLHSPAISNLFGLRAHTRIPTEKSAAHPKVFFC